MHVRAAILCFDFQALITQSSFLSMVKAISPRNLALLQTPTKATAEEMTDRVAAALAGTLCHVHSPAAGDVLPMPATAVYVAALTPELAAQLEQQAKVKRGPYQLGWLDGVVVSAHLLLPSTTTCLHCWPCGPTFPSVLPVRLQIQSVFGRPFMSCLFYIHPLRLLGSGRVSVPWHVHGCSKSRDQASRDAWRAEIDKQTGQPILGVPPTQDTHTPAGVFLGNMMVSDMTQRLKRKQLAVEQDGDAAVVDDGTVLVRQEGDEAGAALAIEGTLSAAFYDVRDEVYRQYRLVPQDATS